MAEINKVVYGDKTLIDLSSDTVTPETLGEGATAHNAAGEVITGTMASAQSEYDKFWDAYQQNGNRTDYENAFAGRGWNNATFKPKYNMTPTSGYMMFRYMQCEAYDIMDDIGIAIDFKNATNMNYAFYMSSMTHIGELNISNATLTQNMLYTIAVKNIDKIVCSEKTAFFANTMNVCTALETVTFEGTIASGFDVKLSTKLTHDSLTSIISCLKDYSGSGTTYTLTIGPTNYAKLTADEINAAEAKGWVIK